MPHLSIVSPVYRAEKIIPVLVDRIKKAVAPITDDYEIILVEDCGPDNSWKVIEDISVADSKVVGIKLSRNFGQHYAITAGLDHAKGEWIVVMDCDLQDVPEEIPNLYAKAQEGFDVVLARRHVRKDGFFKTFFSAAFYRTLGYLTGSEQDESVANFGIYSRKAIDAVISMREPIRYFPTMVKWVGFRATKINVLHDNRLEGESSYNYKRLFNLAIDIILANSDKPLRLFIKAGVTISLISFVLALFTIYRWLTGGISVVGYTSLIVSIWMLSGIIMAILGVVGLYVGKTFEGVKQRPLYVVEKKVNA
ncbi:MAG: glycosyltransferase family 2 protein [Bacteroidota bacterium]